MLEYLAPVDFEGKQVVLIPTSGGIGWSGLAYFKNATTDADGVVLSTLQLQIFEADAGERAILLEPKLHWRHSLGLEE